MLTKVLKNDRLWRRIVLLTVVLIIILIVAFGIRYNLSIAQLEPTLNAIKTLAVETARAR